VEIRFTAGRMAENPVSAVGQIFQELIRRAVAAQN
jgi:hypothetical protein